MQISVEILNMYGELKFSLMIQSELKRETPSRQLLHATSIASSGKQI